MGIKKRKMLCIIAAVIVFLSGICLESTRANALFVYPSVPVTDDYIASVDGSGMEEQLCTSDMLGVRLDAGLCQRIHRMHTQRRGIGNVLHVLYPDIFSVIKESRYSCFMAKQFCHLCQDVSVIKYIHQSDGKKRNESLIINTF